MSTSNQVVVNSFLDDIREKYLKRTQEFADLLPSHRHFFTSSGNRIDIRIEEDRAVVLNNGVESLVFNFEDINKSREEIKILNFDTPQIRTLLSLDLENPNINDEIFTQMKASKILNNVEYIVSKFEAGYSIPKVKVVEINIGSDIAPEIHTCLELEELNGAFLIDTIYRTLIAKTQTVKYGFRIVDKHQFGRISTFDLSQIDETVAEIARSIKEKN